LNQVEIYFSVIQRKVLTPNDFTSLAEIEERLLGFERRYEQTAAPFEWKFTRHDLASSWSASPTRTVISSLPDAPEIRDRNYGPEH